jgi:hypothetical protein
MAGTVRGGHRFDRPARCVAFQRRSRRVRRRVCGSLADGLVTRRPSGALDRMDGRRAFRHSGGRSGGSPARSPGAGLSSGIARPVDTPLRHALGTLLDPHRCGTPGFPGDPGARPRVGVAVRPGAVTIASQVEPPRSRAYPRFEVHHAPFKIIRLDRVPDETFAGVQGLFSSHGAGVLR